MPTGMPASLSTLLHAVEPGEREQAWEGFVAEYSRLILHAIRRYGGSHDDVMDRYAFVLEQLRADDCRRLRTWSGDGRSRLTTWLVVVVQRLCLEHHRQRYGRVRPAGPAATEERHRRRQLADLMVQELDPNVVPTDGLLDGLGADPEQTIRAAELSGSLAAAVAELDASDQLLLTLRFRDARSAAAIARVMSLATPFHVYRRLNHVLGRLRQSLRERGIDDPAP